MKLLHVNIHSIQQDINLRKNIVNRTQHVKVLRPTIHKWHFIKLHKLLYIIENNLSNEEEAHSTGQKKTQENNLFNYCLKGREAYAPEQRNLKK